MKLPVTTRPNPGLDLSDQEKYFGRYSVRNETKLKPQSLKENLIAAISCLSDMLERVNGVEPSMFPADAEANCLEILVATTDGGWLPLFCLPLDPKLMAKYYSPPTFRLQLANHPEAVAPGKPDASFTGLADQQTPVDAVSFAARLAQHNIPPVTPTDALLPGGPALKLSQVINGSLEMNPAEVVLLGLKHSPNSVDLRPSS